MLCYEFHPHVWVCFPRASLRFRQFLRQLLPHLSPCVQSTPVCGLCQVCASSAKIFLGEKGKSAAEICYECRALQGAAELSSLSSVFCLFAFSI